MNFSSSKDSLEAAREEAARWTLRQDRGLTPEEQDAFSQWLASDPENGAAWAEQRWGWNELDRLAGLEASRHTEPDCDLLAVKRRDWLPFLAPLTAAAALVALGLFFWASPARTVPPHHTEPSPTATEPTPLALIEERTLPDGSVVALNRGASLSLRFTPGERRVLLEKGEAFFKVAKDRSRPFVVQADKVSVQAVGTAFNVQLGENAVEVLVTEGQVGVSRRSGAIEQEGASHAGWTLPVSLGQRTVVPLDPTTTAPRAEPLMTEEIDARLSWQPRLLDFTDAPLSEIVAAFNRHNPIRLSLRDSSLDGLRLSTTFRSDNLEGFLRLLQSDFAIRVERSSEGEIELSQP